MTKTPIMGLNLPTKGDFDWDVPMNENFQILDSLGSGRLPFMTPLIMEHILDEEDSIGWALQGSELDGDVYTTAWSKLSAAKARSSSETWTFGGVGYQVYVDPQTTWVFVDKSTYDNAKEALGHSLGFVVDFVEGAKRIILPYKEGYLKVGSEEIGKFIPEGLPNITGDFDNYAHKFGLDPHGAFYQITKGAGHTTWQEYTQATALRLGFDASRISDIYGASNHVTPQGSTFYLYYRVADSAVSQAQIDLAQALSKLAELEARIEALEE